jgi:hypothetical protein
MWSYILRRVLYSIPIYLGIIFIVMAALRVNDPVNAYLGKNATEEQKALKRHSMGLDTPFLPVARYDPTLRVEPWAKVEWTRPADGGGHGALGHRPLQPAGQPVRPVPPQDRHPRLRQPG